MITRRVGIIGGVVIVLACILLAVGGVTAYSAYSHEKPTVIINSPPSNSSYHVGESVTINSTSSDPADIVRVDLKVDGATVSASTPPIPQKDYAASQTWTATPGSHTITITAYNKQNQPSAPVSVTVNVLPEIAQAPTPQPTPTVVVAPTAAAAPTPAVTPSGGVVPATGGIPPIATPTNAPAGACTNSATFVTDVTVPDGTALAPGQTFNKIWRVRNSGTCTWGSGYSFNFLNGEQMGASSLVFSVPATPSGATADLLVPMIAPVAGGTHTSFWQLRTPAGTRFGVVVFVTINVIAPIPQTGGCFGTPAISAFSASPNSITQGQATTLSWGFVSNATSVDISNGIGNVVTPGSVVVAPTFSTVYTLTAHCGATISTAQMTITVFASAPPVATCSGLPQIASFGASPTQITRGQSTTLFWGFVNNAVEAQIDNGIGGIGTPGSLVVAPGATTTYTLSAFCGSNVTNARVTVGVNP